MEIERIKKAMKKYELPMANIHFSKRLFEVFFKRPDLQINSYKRRVIDGKGFEYTGNVPDKLGVKLGENEIKILELMKDNKYITTKELSEHIKISTTAVDNNISKLKEKGILERIGPAKGGHWEVIEK